MNKIIALILIFFSSFGFSQSDSIVALTNEAKIDSIRNLMDSVYFNEPIVVTPKHFESNFREKYNSSDFKYDTVVDSKNATAWQRFWKAVGDFFGRIFNFKNGEKALTGFEIFMKIAAFFIIAFVIYLLVKLLVGQEGQWLFSKNKKKIIVSEMVEENIHTINFNDIISKSKANKEYRVTIRYYYLWLLKSLSDNEIIEWDIEKTNSDYLYEIQSQIVRDNFKYLSYIYDYIWYGEFEINENDFLKAETVFQKAIANKK
ncbi:DUF4129 domain-containing protein [Flavobacterium sp. J27]|uniref:DUF4129 domain-containing protein n=1 Tax=Flavobacterium sp. J27 TaxID=2060419 RepID=UPI001030DE5D|nr:DUF4129 domain-containing protein [Flavobacterium sp. J27]